MMTKFSPAIKKTIVVSREQAILYGYDYIDVVHLVLALLADADGTVPSIIASMGVDLSQLQLQIHNYLGPSGDKHKIKGSIPLTKRAETVLKDTVKVRDVFIKYGPYQIDTIHLMLAILQNPDETTWVEFGDERIKYDSFLLACKTHYAQKEAYKHLVIEDQPKSFLHQLKKRIGLTD